MNQPKTATSSASTLISLSQLASLLGCSYAAARGRVLRAIDLPRQYKPNPNGHAHIMFIPLSALIERGWVSAEHVMEWSRVTPTTLGTQLMARMIVRKKFEGLSEDEQRLLVEAIGGQWRDMPLVERVKRLALYVGKSKAWLYRFRGTPQRKRSILDRLTIEQSQKVEALVITARTFKQFKAAVNVDMHNEVLPRVSMSTWRRVWAALTVQLSGQRTLLHQGPRAHRQSLPSIHRANEILKPMELCSTDYWRIDVMVRWHDRSLCSPYLCAIRDERTLMIVGLAITKNPCALGVKTAIYYALSRFGMIGTLQMDNGKEFRARVITGGKFFKEQKKEWVKYGDEIRDEMRLFTAKGILPAMNIQAYHSKAHMPRAKGIERAWVGFSDWAEGMNGYVGRNYWEKSEHIEYAKTHALKNDVDEYMDEATGEIIKFMDYRELSYAVMQYVNAYNTTASTADRLGGVSPLEKWNELTLNNRPKTVRSHELAFAFCDKQVRKVGANANIVWARGIEYQHVDLRAMRGKRVLMLWNPLDGVWLPSATNDKWKFAPRSVLLYDEQHRFLCEAPPLPRFHPYLEDHATLAQTYNRNKTILDRETEDVKRAIALAQGLPVPVLDVKNVTPEIAEKAQAHKKRSQWEEEKRFLLKAKEYAIPGAEFVDIEDMEE